MQSESNRGILQYSDVPMVTSLRLKAGKGKGLNRILPEVDVRLIIAASWVLPVATK